MHRPRSSPEAEPNRSVDKTRRPAHAGKPFRLQVTLKSQHFMLPAIRAPPVAKRNRKTTKVARTQAAAASDKMRTSCSGTRSPYFPFAIKIEFAKLWIRWRNPIKTSTRNKQLISARTIHARPGDCRCAESYCSSNLRRIDTKSIEHSRPVMLS